MKTESCQAPVELFRLGSFTATGCTGTMSDGGTYPALRLCWLGRDGRELFTTLDGDEAHLLKTRIEAWLKGEVSS